MSQFDQLMVGLDGQKRIGDATEADWGFQAKLNDFYRAVTEAATRGSNLAGWLLEETGAPTLADLPEPVRQGVVPVLQLVTEAADLIPVTDKI